MKARRGVVHRDVKPANLFLPGGDAAAVKILDFGIARLADATYTLTDPDAPVGTPAYMAPEQIRGEPDVDARADVDALGCVLFECLTGRPPFAGAHVVALLTKVLFEEAPRLRELWSGAPPALDALLSRTPITLSEREMNRQGAKDAKKRRASWRPWRLGGSNSALF